jgi:hypothetical protein
VELREVEQEHERRSRTSNGRRHRRNEVANPWPADAGEVPKPRSPKTERGALDRGDGRAGGAAQTGAGARTSKQCRPAADAAGVGARWGGGARGREGRRASAATVEYGAAAAAAAAALGQPHWVGMSDRSGGFQVYQR